MQMRKITRIMIGIGCLLTAFLPVFAQTSVYPFTHLTTEQGLTADSIYAICQDERGFIWLGSEDGLLQYDGYTFTKHVGEADDPLIEASNWVREIFPAENGDFWVIFERNGLARFDSHSGKLKTKLPDPILDKVVERREISAILKDRNENLWLGTKERGLYRFDRRQKKISPVSLPRGRNSPPTLFISQLFLDHQGRVWIGTWGDGLYRIGNRPDRIDHFVYEPRNPASLSNNLISILTEDQDGTVWIGTAGGGLNRVIPGPSGRIDFKRYLKEPNNPNSLSHNDVRALCAVRSGQLWIGTDGGGVNLLDPRTGQFTHLVNQPGDPRSLGSSSVTCIFEDRSGLIWIGFWGSKLDLYNPRHIRFSHFQTNPDDLHGMSSNEIRSLLEDRSGTLWIGTWGGGLNRWDHARERFVHYLPDELERPLMTNNAITSLLEDRRGILWVATASGKLCRFNRQQRRFETLFRLPQQTAPAQYVRTIIEDRTGRIWLGTLQNNLIKLDSRFQVERVFGPLAGDAASVDINDICEAAGGLFWIGTDRGLICFDPATESLAAWATEPPAELKKGLVLFIKDDRETNSLWIGSASGLYQYSLTKKEFIPIGRQLGLPSWAYADFIRDPAGTVWLPTTNGLIRLDLRKRIFRVFTVNDGLLSNLCNLKASGIGRDGEIFIGHNNGLDRFRPEELQDNPFVPPVVLTGVADRSGPVRLETDVSELREFTLSQARLPVTLTFAALCFADPDRNQYAYKLENRDREWTLLGNHHQLSLDRLAVGRYRLRIKGSNADGNWNEQGIAFTLIVTRPFWKNGWFLAGLSLLFLAALFFAIQRWVVKRHPALTQPVSPEILASFCSRHDISKREQEIIELVIKGKSNQQIEEILFISLRTVKTHLYNIYQKVGIKNRLQLLYKIQRWQA